MLQDDRFRRFRRFRNESFFVPLVLLALLAALGCSSPSDDGDGDDDFADRMAVEHADDTTEPSPAAEQAPESPVESEEVAYGNVAGTEVRGYLARPQPADDSPAETGRPAVLVIHEWWGLNDNIRAMADRLAGEGYVALAVDLYSGRSADDPEGARALATEAREKAEQVGDNLRQARAYLSEQVGASKIGTVGWCFGGGWSLETALLMPGEVDATVIFYGRVETDRERLAALDTPILGLFGAEDRGIPVETVREFEQALADLGKPGAIHVYEGADHAFANPSGNRYHAEAAEDAWEKVLAFFEQHLWS